FGSGIRGGDTRDGEGRAGGGVGGGEGGLRGLAAVAGLMEEEALGQVDAEVAYGLELFVSFDALGDDLCALAFREADHRLDEILFEEVRVDVRDQGDVELDVVRREVGDRAETGVAAPSVVDREAEASFPERGEVFLEPGVILDR